MPAASNSVYPPTNSAFQVSSHLSKRKPQEISNHTAEPKRTKNAVAPRVTAEDSQWEGFEELDKVESKDSKRASEITNTERDASKASPKPKERRNTERKNVISKQAPSKGLDNPFEALAKVDYNTDDAGDEIDGKRVIVSIGNNAY